MLKTIKQIKNLKNKTVLLRGDLDVPVKNGKIVDDFRLRRLLPTIQYLAGEGADIIIMGHLGRPGGQRDDAFSIKPVVDELGQLLDEDLRKQKNKKTKKQFNDFKHYCITEDICLLENLRFYKGEEKNDLKFAKRLAGLADIYVNDSFANSHRKHASIVGVAKFLPAYIGLNFEQEVKVLSRVIKNPKKPSVAILGGVKLETKLPLIKKLSDDFDYVLVGGRLGIEMEKLPPLTPPYKGGGHALPLLCKKVGQIVLPVDYVGTGKFDIGKKTIKLYTEILKNAKTVVWNGPMGKFEDKKYMAGTRAIANSIKKSKAYSVVGGGDVISALHHLEMLDKLNFVSTGGGAMLEFLEKGDLVGLRALGQREFTCPPPTLLK